MVPGPDDDEVLVPSVFLLEDAIRRERSVEIFLIPPSSHVKCWHRRCVEARSKGLSLPEFIVVWMPDKIIPRRDRILEMERIHVGERSEPQEPIIDVVSAEREEGVGFGSLFHEGILKPVTETERSVVVEIIAQEHVGRGSLLGGRFHRRMSLDRPHDSRPAAVRNAEHPGAAIVVRDVLQQPVDRIIGVRALVDRTRILPVAGHPLHFEPPF